MEIVTIDQVKDFVERVAWTFIEAYIGLGLIDWLSGGINLSLWHQIVAGFSAAAIATVKVIIAQRIGTHKDGAAIPGGVIKVHRTTG
jgi:hypothetical protein